MIACKLVVSTTGKIQRLCFSKKQRKQHTLEFSKFHSISFHMRCDSTAPIWKWEVRGGVMTENLGEGEWVEMWEHKLHPPGWDRVNWSDKIWGWGERETLPCPPPGSAIPWGHVVTLILEFSSARWLHIFSLLYPLYFLFFHTSLRNNFSIKLLAW